MMPKWTGQGWGPASHYVRLVARKSMTFTPAQCRAARGLLAWSPLQLGQAAAVDMRSLRAFESGRTVSSEVVVNLERALGDAGIKFMMLSKSGFGVLLIAIVPEADFLATQTLSGWLWRALLEIREKSKFGPVIQVDLDVGRKTFDSLLGHRLLKEGPATASQVSRGHVTAYRLSPLGMKVLARGKKPKQSDVAPAAPEPTRS
jgi:hypothetical protein